MCAVTRVEVRGQLARVGTHLPLRGSGDRTQIVGLGSNHLYPICTSLGCLNI